ADLCGADLSTARLEKACLMGAKYDEQTRFPPGSQHLLPEMTWAGTATRPPLAGAVSQPTQPQDLAAFLKRLQMHVNPARLKKALEMLKADRFQLYAQAGDEALIG